jgi:hypothetical protein
VTPWYLFVPQDRDLWGEYQKGWKIREVMPTNVLGFQTHRDSFAIDFERAVMQKRIAEMRDTTISDDEFRAKSRVRDIAHLIGVFAILVKWLWIIRDET